MMIRSFRTLLASALIVSAAGAPAAQATSMALDNVQAADGIECRQAEGAYVGLLAPGKGLVLLATQPFPGGSQVGTIDGDRLRFELEGIDTGELALSSGHSGSAAVWGMVDRSLEIGPHTGCISFGRREFTTVDDLKTYLHWMLRDVFFRLGSGTEREPLALQIGDRTVTLEVTPSGHRPVEVRAREGGVTGLQPTGSASVYYFQPLILDADTGRLAVKILRKEGQFFGGEAAEELAVVVVNRDPSAPTRTDPSFEIRCVAIE